MCTTRYWHRWLFLIASFPASANSLSSIVLLVHYMSSFHPLTTNNLLPLPAKPWTIIDQPWLSSVSLMVHSSSLSCRALCPRHLHPHQPLPTTLPPPQSSLRHCRRRLCCSEEVYKRMRENWEAKGGERDGGGGMFGFVGLIFWFHANELLHHYLWYDSYTKKFWKYYSLRFTI